jgi:hypothetical protein
MDSKFGSRLVTLVNQTISSGASVKDQSVALIAWCCKSVSIARIMLLVAECWSAVFKDDFILS